MMKITHSVILLFLGVFFANRSHAQDWLWGRGNTGNDVEGWAVATDPSGNVFVGGVVEGTANTKFGTVSVPHVGAGSQSVIVKYDGSGNVVWANGTTDSSSNSWVTGITADINGNSFMFGTFTGKTVGFGTVTLTNTVYPYPQYYLAKYDPAGNVLWAINAGNALYGAASIGGISYVLGPGGITTDGSGNVYITGNFNLPAITIGTITLTNTDPTGQTDDIFIAKYDPMGNVVWAKSAGGNKSDDAYSIAVTPSGAIYIAGDFASGSITFGPSVITSSSAGYAQIAFIAKFDASGNPLWACASGGNGGEYAVGLASDLSNNIYLTGGLKDNSIAFGGKTITNPTPGRDVLYLVKFDPSNNVSWYKTIFSPNSSTGSDSFRTGAWGYSIAVSKCGVVWVSGAFNDSVNIDGHILKAPLQNGNLIDPVFAAGYNSTGYYAGSTALSSGGDDQNGIACDPAGNLFMCSDYIASSPFQAGPDVLPVGGAKIEYLYVAKYLYLNGSESFKHSNSDACLANGITLFAPAGYNHFVWGDGSTGATYQVRDTGLYWVYSYDSCSASSSDTFNVGITCACGRTLFLPNSFTPNGDGMNDVFYPRSSTDVKQITSFRIYNRWGELLFERANIVPNDATNAWDGTFGGDKPRPDVYVWVVDVVCENDTKITKKGSLTIIR